MKQEPIILNGQNQQFVPGQRVTIKQRKKGDPRGYGTVFCNLNRRTVLVSFGKRGWLYGFNADELTFMEPPPARLPISTPVVIPALGTDAVISQFSETDVDTYKLSYFDPRARKVEHVWLTRSAFEVAA